MENLE
jgi:hypothetical protein